MILETNPETSFSTDIDPSIELGINGPSIDLVTPPVALWTQEQQNNALSGVYKAHQQEVLPQNQMFSGVYGPTSQGYHQQQQPFVGQQKQPFVGQQQQPFMAQQQHPFMGIQQQQSNFGVPTNGYGQNRPSLFSGYGRPREFIL
jgi:hypothetical protein